MAQLLAQLCLNRGFTLTTASRGSTVTVLQVRCGGMHGWALCRWDEGRSTGIVTRECAWHGWALYFAQYRRVMLPLLPSMPPQVVFAFALDYVILDRNITASSLIGGVLIIAGVLILTLSRMGGSSSSSSSSGGSAGRQVAGDRSHHVVAVVAEEQLEPLLPSVDPK